MDALVYSLFPIIMLAAVGWGFYKVIFGGIGKQTASGKMVCTRCGTRCEPGTKTKGSMLVEIILWLCFIIPGLIYSLWRLSSKHAACPACGSDQLVPIDSPNGRKLIADNN